MALARAVAAERGENLFLAGGVVRDLLLGRPIRDVDLVIEGDPVAFSRRLASGLGAKVRAHERFATATLLGPAGARLDVAATRRERYPRPGALPVATPGAPIAEDLARRDFTVNALALSLRTTSRLVDPFEGRADLKRGLVRALHEGSFRDDPTRALRAVRYANRLGFRLERATRRWLVEAIRGGALDCLSGDRLRRELVLIFDEPRRARAVESLERLGIGGAIHPALSRRRGAGRRVRRAEVLSERVCPAAPWLCYLLAWMGTATEEEVRGVAKRLGASGAEGRRLLEWPRTTARFPAGAARRTRSELRRAAQDLSGAELVALAAVLKPADARALLDAALGSDTVRLTIRGKDLVSAGVRPGPAIGRALEATRAALEDGRIEAGQQLGYALGVARGEGS